MIFSRLSQASVRTRLIIGAVLLVVLYGYFIFNVSTKPPGFYVDETCLAYNGYLIATTGAGENGTSYPLYFQCYTQGYSQWANPTHVYLLAALYSVIPPSNLSARIFAATMVFLAALLMGLLARKISGRTAVGVIVAITAMFTPWLFEISRMVLETFFYPLAVAMFLYCLYRAHVRGTWNIVDCLLLALSLALISYSYTIGRLLGPVLGLGLLIFATSWRQLLRVVLTGVLYSIAMIPFLVVYFGNSAAITGRFQRATIVDSTKPFSENFFTVLGAFISDLSPEFLLLVGDKHPRHHIAAGMGEILVGTFALALFGVVIILLRHRRSPWWWYVIFGTLVSVIPGSLTTERHHALRLIAFPVFFLLLMVPGISWLLGDRDSHKRTDETAGGLTGWLQRNDLKLRHGLLAALLVLTAIQAVAFQVIFHEIGDKRSTEFNEAYPRVLRRALDLPDRPIYLDDGAEPAYIHAYWYGASWGVDPSNFVHLLDNQFAPYGALIVSDTTCTECEVIHRESVFSLYRSKRGDVPAMPARTETGLVLGSGTGQFSRPRGIAIDASGNRYVADTDNSRVQKFDPEGKFLAIIGSPGEGEGEMKQPHGVDVDGSGNIYVTDAYRHRLMKFRSDGSFLKEWPGPTDIGLYGPRDLAFGERGVLYIVDQGRARIVRFDTGTEEFTYWGSQGTAEGQFDQPTGIGIANGLIFVADIGNDRVQVFDLTGKFIRQWAVPEWQRNVPTFPDIAYEPASNRVFVSSGQTTEVRVYSVNGEFLESFVSRPPLAILNNPSSMVIRPGPYGPRLLVLNTGSDNPVTGQPGMASIDLGEQRRSEINQTQK